MKPMLAKKYNEHKDKLEYPCFVQPKINGVRMLYHAGQCQSRDGKLWHPSMLRHIRNALVFIPYNLVLDGELYVHGWSLQNINSAISVNRTAPNAHTHLVQYHVFDVFNLDDPEATFAERHPMLVQALYRITLGYDSKIFLVDTNMMFSEALADQQYKLYKDLRFEGMMYRQAKAPYGIEQNCTNIENRWDVLLKRKDWLDDEFQIVDVESGTGKYADAVGALVLKMSNGIYFSAGSGLSDLQRYSFMDNPPIGKQARIRYEMLSDTGVPLKPTIEAILD